MRIIKDFIDRLEKRQKEIEYWRNRAIQFSEIIDSKINRGESIINCHVLYRAHARKYNQRKFWFQRKLP